MRFAIAVLTLIMAAACSGGSSGGPYTATPASRPGGVRATACPATGVEAQVTHLVDLASLTGQPTVAVALKRGDTLFIGASDCGQYRVPPSSAVRPVLVETQVVGGGFPALGAWYAAAAGGQVTVVIDCAGECRFAVYRVTVTVT